MDIDPFDKVFFEGEPLVNGYKKDHGIKLKLPFLTLVTILTIVIVVTIVTMVTIVIIVAIVTLLRYTNPRKILMHPPHNNFSNVTNCRN